MTLENEFSTSIIRNVNMTQTRKENTVEESESTTNPNTRIVMRSRAREWGVMVESEHD